jgi:hypothetical protein
MSGLPEQTDRQTDRQQCVERAHATARGLARPAAWGQSAAGGARRWRTRERTAATLIVAFWRPAPTITQHATRSTQLEHQHAPRSTQLEHRAGGRAGGRAGWRAGGLAGERGEKVAHLRGTERTAAPLIAPIAPNAPVFGAVAHAGQ